jgi:hypothetical protein
MNKYKNSWFKIPNKFSKPIKVSQSNQIINFLIPVVLFYLLFSEWPSSLNIELFKKFFMEVIVMYNLPPPTSPVLDSQFEDTPILSVKLILHSR